MQNRFKKNDFVQWTKKALGHHALSVGIVCEDHVSGPVKVDFGNGVVTNIDPIALEIYPNDRR